MDLVAAFDKPHEPAYTKAWRDLAVKVRLGGTIAQER